MMPEEIVVAFCMEGMFITIPLNDHLKAGSDDQSMDVDDVGIGLRLSDKSSCQVAIDYNEDDTAICGVKAVLHTYYKPSCSLIDSRIILSYSYRGH